jgi:hypothetical protein
MSTPRPFSPLDAAQRAFDLLTRPPAPLAFDGRGVAGRAPRRAPRRGDFNKRSRPRNT